MSVTGKPLLVPGVGKVSGSVASFADSNGKPLRSCIVTMEPIQSGTGDPSPDNIRPISGRTVCNVYSAPRIIAFEPTQSGAGTPSPENVRPIVPGLTFERDDGTQLTVYGGELDTETGVLINKNGVLNITQNTDINRYSSSGNRFCFLASDFTSVGGSKVDEITCDTLLTVSKNSVATSTYAISGSDKGSHFIIFNVGLIELEDVKDWLSEHPYTVVYKKTQYNTYQLSRAEVARAVEALGVAPVTVQLGQTVYGGTLNVVTGELTVEQTLSELSTEASKWDMLGSGAYLYYRCRKPDAKSSPTAICTHFVKTSITTSTSNIGFSVFKPASLGEYVIAVRPDVTTIDTVPKFVAWLKTQEQNGTPVCACYNMSDPITYQLTPAQVSTVLGANAVWSPDWDTAAEYYKKSMLFMS